MKHVTPERKFIELLINNPNSALAVDFRYTDTPALGIHYRNRDGFTFMEAKVMGETRWQELSTRVRFIDNKQMLDMTMYDIGVQFTFLINGATYVHWAIMEPRMRTYFLETCFPDVEQRRTTVCEGYFLNRILHFFRSITLLPNDLMRHRIVSELGRTDDLSFCERLDLFIKELENLE